RVERTLQDGMTQPGQGVEQVVPAVFAGGDVAAFGDALFVVQAVGEQFAGLRHEAFAHAIWSTGVERLDGWPVVAFDQVGVFAPRGERHPLEYLRVDRGAGRRQVAGFLHAPLPVRNNPPMAVTFMARLAINCPSTSALRAYAQDER